MKPCWRVAFMICPCTMYTVMIRHRAQLWYAIERIYDMPSYTVFLCLWHDPIWHGISFWHSVWHLSCRHGVWCRLGVLCRVDKSHLAKSRPAPPDWQTFLNSFRFFLEIFNCPYCRTGWGSIVSWLRQPSSFPQLSASVKNPPKVATHPSPPLNTAFHITKNLPVENRW